MTKILSSFAFSKEIADLQNRNIELEDEKQTKVAKKEGLFANREKFAKELEEKEENGGNKKLISRNIRNEKNFENRKVDSYA